MSSLLLSPSDLLDQVSESFYRRGADYQRSGRVLSSATQQREWSDIVTGRVRGSGEHVYTVYVQLERDAHDDVSVDGDCSCPVGYNCKHVVAVLLEEAQKRDAGTAIGPGEAGAASPDNTLLETWASQLGEAAGAPPGVTHPADVPERLLYLLDLREYPAAAPRAIVETITCRALKRGGYGKASRFNAERALEPYPPGFLLNADIEILRLLGGGRAAGLGRELALSGELGARVLEAMLGTGRCHWRDKDMPALALGRPRPAACHWRLADDGRQWLAFDATPPIAFTLAVAPPWYVDPDAGYCGPLATGLSPAVAAAAAQAPPVVPAQAQQLPPAVQRVLAELALPAPRVLTVAELTGPPTACLQLLPGGSQKQAPRPRDWYRSVAPTPPRARLSFDYAGVEFPFDPSVDTGPTITRRDERLVRVRRDPLSEEHFIEELRGCGLAPMVTIRPMAALGGDAPFDLVADLNVVDASEADAWRLFLRHQMPRLRAAGWRIQVDEGFDHRIATPEGWYGDARESGESGWFDLDLGVIVDGQRRPLLPLLHQWVKRSGTLEALEGLADDDEVVVQEPDGRSLFLPAARVRTILKTLIELCDPDLRLSGDGLRLPGLRAAQVEGLAGGDDPAAPWRWQGGERLRALAEKLKSFQGIAPLAPPPGFDAELRPYQRQGLGWLQFLRDLRLGGILADDMGLGKTVQTLAHLLTDLRAGRLDRPSLVVSPTSLVTNWAMEARRFAPDLDVLTLHGPRRKARFPDIAGHHLVLTTYALALRDREALAAQPYHLLILDEAQAIKNPRAKVTRALASLEARSRLCLTGTPMENHLGELWSLIHFLEPGLLGDQRQFRRLFRNPIEKHGDVERQAILQRRLAPVMLRRTKGEVLGELPDKTEIERVVELESRQRDLYETIRLAMHDKIQGAIARQGLARSQILILDALLKLRQVCCDPRLVKLEAARGVRASAKLALLMDLLPEMVEEGRRVLLFSQFTAMLALIEEALTGCGLDFVKLTGRTRDRVTPIRRFQAEEIPIFLISLKAGGTGLNLTAADTVIHYDPWWNPAVQDQATDRAHRIGQSKKVFVYKLVTAGTVEQKILAMQARKRRLAASVFSESGAQGAARLSAEDLERLFAPLD